MIKPVVRLFTDKKDSRQPEQERLHHKK